MLATQSTYQHDGHDDIHQRVVDSVQSLSISEDEIGQARRHANCQSSDAQLYCLIEGSRVHEEERPRAERAYVVVATNPFEEAVVTEDMPA